MSIIIQIIGLYALVSSLIVDVLLFIPAVREVIAKKHPLALSFMSLNNILGLALAVYCLK